MNLIKIKCLLLITITIIIVVVVRPAGPGVCAFRVCETAGQLWATLYVFDSGAYQTREGLMEKLCLSLRWIIVAVRGAAPVSAPQH